MRTFLGKAMTFLLPARPTAKFVLNFAYYDKGKISEEQMTPMAAPLVDRERALHCWRRRAMHSFRR